MRVLHVIPSMSHVHGGPTRALELMEKALAAIGVSVATVTTDDDGPGRRLRASDMEARHNGAARYYVRKWLDLYKVAPGIISWLWRNIGSFDVVDVHALFSFTSTVACLIAHRRGVPYIVRPLGTLAPYGLTQRRPWLKKLSLRFIEGPLLKRAAAVHFTSQAEWEAAKALGIHFRGSLIPLGVEATVLDAPTDMRRSFPQIGQRKVVLYLGRLDPKKNVGGLLRAAQLIDWSAIGAVLAIAGDGDRFYVAELKRLARNLGIEAHVLWLGHLEDGRKAAALAGSDIFVLASFSENFGIAAVEALLAGLPCVLAEGVDIARQLAAAGAALIVRPEPEPIANAIASLLVDAAKRSELAIEARLFAEREYSPATMAERLIRLYEDIVARSGDASQEFALQDHSASRDPL